MNKRLLVLGGTEFVGRAVVAEALRAGWSVAVFNRGNNPPLPGAHQLTGDRLAPGGLEVLERGSWDVVVDTWSWAPVAVRNSAQLLKDRAEHYVYISSRSVYQMPNPDSSESAPTVDASPDETGDDDYAISKAGGEVAAVEAFGDRALLARAGLILGPHENVGRLPWWLTRIAEGGKVLAPEPRAAGLQYIDARDMAIWVLAAAQRGVSGAFNTVSQPGHTTMAEFLDTCIRVTGAQAELCWRDPAAIQAAGIKPWVELPVWLPPGELYRSMHQADVSKAIAAGLVCRPIGETVADTWKWMLKIGGPAPVRADRPPRWLSREKEARLVH